MFWVLARWAFSLANWHDRYRAYKAENASIGGGGTEWVRGLWGRGFRGSGEQSVMPPAVLWGAQGGKAGPNSKTDLDLPPWLIITLRDTVA